MFIIELFFILNEWEGVGRENQYTNKCLEGKRYDKYVDAMPKIATN